MNLFLLALRIYFFIFVEKNTKSIFQKVVNFKVLLILEILTKLQKQLNCKNQFGKNHGLWRKEYKEMIMIYRTLKINWRRINTQYLKRNFCKVKKKYVNKINKTKNYQQKKKMKIKPNIKRSKMFDFFFQLISKLKLLYNYETDKIFVLKKVFIYEKSKDKKRNL